MPDSVDDLFKRPLQVFDLPPELVATLEPIQSQPKDEGNLSTLDIPTLPEKAPSQDLKSAASCGLCLVAFSNVADQRHHFRSDWHGYNARQTLRGQAPLSEDAFEEVVGDLDSSISGSDVSDADEEADMAPTKLEPDAPVSTGHNVRQAKSTGSPVILVTSSLLPNNTFLSVYKSLLSGERTRSESAVEYLRAKQLRYPTSSSTQSGQGPSNQSKLVEGPNYFLCMIGGGHFAAMVVSPVPNPNKQTLWADHQPRILAHKTFHRYTTRRKQGGAQSANDAAKGNAHSAGAGIRRHNEVALQAEVRGLLNDWRALIGGCELLFIRASGPANRRTLFGPYEKLVLKGDDPRIRSFPFSTRRPIKRELLRAFSELTTVKIIRREKEESLNVAKQISEVDSNKKPTSRKNVSQELSAEEEEALLHTSQLQTLIRRSKAPGVLSYLEKNGLSPNFIFHPPDNPSNHHAPRPLHLASKLGSGAVVMSLLSKANADPTVQSPEGKTPCDLVSDRATRDVFRIARFELGEGRWDWDRAHCPSPMSKAEVEKKAEVDRQEAKKGEAARREAELKQLEADERARAPQAPSQSSGRALGGEVTGSDRREQEARGLPPELRMKLEREKRARAAEERLKKLSIK